MENVTIHVHLYMYSYTPSLNKPYENGGFIAEKKTTNNWKIILGT